MGELPERPGILVTVTPHFQRRAKKLSVEKERGLARALRLLQQDPTDPRLGTHKLQGKHSDKWACSCGYDARVVFFWEGTRVVLLDVGSHDEVYG